VDVVALRTALDLVARRERTCFFSPRSVRARPILYVVTCIEWGLICYFVSSWHGFVFVGEFRRVDSMIGSRTETKVLWWATSPLLNAAHYGGLTLHGVNGPNRQRGC
jgi:hypothetical protein